MIDPEQDRHRLLEWLMANGGPAVRYRTALELCGDFSCGEQAQLEQDLLDTPLAQTWLARLDLGNLAGELNHLTHNTLTRLGWLVHGSKPDQLENVLGKLNELGLRAGIAALDQHMLPLMEIYRWHSGWQPGEVYHAAWEDMIKAIFAWGLLRAGYTPNQAMRDFLSDHLAALHAVAQDAVYDIYATPEELVGLPKAWAGKPILKPSVMARYHLPTIHDLYVLAYLPEDMRDARTEQIIEDVINYILDPRFQAFQPGYGQAWIKERRTCYAWGWSPHLAGYQGFHFPTQSAASLLIQQVDLMAHFPAARRSDWFQKALDHLETFRTHSGVYCFPPRYLRESTSGGYYVSGALMGLGENRHRRLGMELESTFHMLRIQKEIA